MTVPSRVYFSSTLKLGEDDPILTTLLLGAYCLFQGLLLIVLGTIPSK